MDRKGIIAVTLSVIVLVVWWVYNDKEMKKLAAANAAQVEVEKAKAEAEAKAKGTTAPATTATTSAPEITPAQPAAEEKTEELPTTSVNYLFTNLGGGIKRARLNNHEAERGTQMV